MNAAKPRSPAASPPRTDLPPRLGAARDADETSEVSEIRPRLGIPRVAAPSTAIRGLPLDPRAAFLLHCIDGETPVDALCDVTGFSLREVLAVLARLERLGAVELAAQR